MILRGAAAALWGMASEPDQAWTQFLSDAGGFSELRTHMECPNLSKSSGSPKAPLNQESVIKNQRGSAIQCKNGISEFQ